MLEKLWRAWCLAGDVAGWLTIGMVVALWLSAWLWCGTALYYLLWVGPEKGLSPDAKIPWW